MYLVVKIKHHTNKAKHHGKKYFCQCCLQCLSPSKISRSNKGNFLTFNHTKSVLQPKEGTYNEFQHFKRLSKTTFASYAYFECVLVPSTGKNCNDPNTDCSSGYKLIYVDEQYSKPYKSYFGDDTIENVLNDMIHESEYVGYLKGNI